jgi:FkbM family methyltransferase
VPDCASFLSAFREIFANRCYAFKSAGIKPRILDLGANIGLSVLFFKTEYPGAEIEAFEADPAIFGYLQKNIFGNGWDDVRLINSAAWHENTVLQFEVEGADGGRVARSGGENVVNVSAIDISEFMSDKHYDFMKIDIEGAEVGVLSRCRDKLKNVDHLFVEYHSVIGWPQRLHELLEILTSAGFRYHIHSPNPTSRPFMGTDLIIDYDLLLNIFAWRDGSNAI